VRELNMHLFFNAIVAAFRAEGVGESKMRTIVAAICAGELRIPTPAEVDTYMPGKRLSNLFLNDPIRSRVKALAEAYNQPRELQVPFLNIRVNAAEWGTPPKASRAIDRGAKGSWGASSRAWVVTCTINAQNINVFLPRSFSRWLHSQLGNSASYKYFALWCALRIYRYGAADAAPIAFMKVHDDIAEHVKSVMGKKYTVIDFKVPDMDGV
jgi:hypothetical protein